MRLRIVAINDVYSLENLPRLASLVRAEAETDPADLLLVTVAGDFLSPSILTSLDAGRGMVDCLNALGVTHVTFGNHEDDLEPDDLRARIAELDAYWLATNVRALDPRLPVSTVHEVRGVRFGLLGVVMADGSMYRRPPFGGAPIANANESALREARRLVDEEGCAFVIPLTHQFIEDDRALAALQGAPRFPVILGGHEHHAFLETVQGTFIVKGKVDAASAAIIDITHDGAETRTEARLAPVDDFPEDREMRGRVLRHMARVRELEEATILTLAEGETLSSVDTRASQTSMGTLVASAVRDAMGAEGCVFNGGGIRGNRVYTDRLTYGALKSEVPFDNEVVVVAIPGRVLAEAIAASRKDAPTPSGGFLQVDDRMHVEGAESALRVVAGANFDPDRDYRIALVRTFLLGLDDIEPLVRFALEHPERVPPADTGRDVRMVLADAFSVRLWHTLGGFDAVDENGDGTVTPSEVERALVRVTGQEKPAITAGLIVRALDRDRNLVISREDADAVE